MKKLINSKNPSFILIFSVTSLLVFLVCVNQPIDPDMWWHLRNGQLVFSQGTITTVDLFSFTKLNQPWTNAFWLSDLLIYAFYQIGGLTLLVTLFALLGSLTYMTIFMFSSGPYLLRAFLVVLAAISTSPEWTIRPQVISFLIFSCLNTYINLNSNLNWRKIIWLPLLFMFWGNIHGGYIWGVLLLIAVIVGNFIEKYIFKNNSIPKTDLIKFTLYSIFSFLFILINPNGLAILELPFHTINVSIASIMEWSSPNFHELIMQPFLWIILLLIVSLSISKEKVSFNQLLKVLGFLFLAFISQRNIPLAIIVILPILIDKFSEYFPKINQELNLEEFGKVPFKGSKYINTIIILFLFLGCAARIYTQSSEENIKKIYPTRAIEWIHENNPKGNMLNSYNWGGYLIFNLPEYKVFIDGRADLYGNEIISSWSNIINDDPNALEKINSNKINFVLLEPDLPIIENLLDNNWKITYQDSLSVIVSR